MEPVIKQDFSSGELPSESQLAEEFAEFAYIVSHDFNAPLRQIREFSRLLISKLEDKLGDELGEAERKYANFIQDNIKNAESMLEGLLKYSRLNTRTSPYSDVNLTELIAEIRHILQRQLAECNAEISCSSMPIIRGDYGQLKQLLYNLIENAIKFRKKNDIARIIIGAELQNDMWRIFIKDNGIGIPYDMHDAIFTMFKRLNNDEPNSGSGIGLTICKKIVERHKGQISLESAINKGSIFYITLPVETNI